MAKSKKIKVHKCQFVLEADLFKGLDDLWREFCESEPDFTWGDNNRSLVTAKSILDHLYNTAWTNEEQLELLRLRVEKCLPEGGNTYVDLEN